MKNYKLHQPRGHKFHKSLLNGGGEGVFAWGSIDHKSFKFFRCEKTKSKEKCVTDSHLSNAAHKRHHFPVESFMSQ